MSIDLTKNCDSLLTAWKDVLSDKTKTNWALFGYEGQSNTLKVVSKGSEGIEELTEDLNSGKIMYAFLKVNDPKTSLDKCVLINWQGEGANTVRKGLCANHLRDVEKFFCGAHLTLNARNEDEVEPQLIIDKVAKSGSSYSFKAPKSEVNEPTGPVGTVYQRVNPVKEINSKERDQFWQREEEEEKLRVQQERTRKEAEKLKLEEEAKRRELDDYTKRERNNVNNRKTEEIIVASPVKIVEEERFEAPGPKVNQSDLMRQQRNQETQFLIGQRTIDARSIFEQNTASGQIKRVPEKPVRNSILKAQALAQSTENSENVAPPVTEASQIASKPNEEQSDEESEHFSTIKRSPRDAVKKSNSNDQDLINNAYNNKQETVQHITDQQFVDEYLYGGFSTKGLQAKALYDYQAADDTEITFDPGDIITNIDQVDEGWWQGLGPDGTYGLFPANYVELLP